MCVSRVEAGDSRRTTSSVEGSRDKYPCWPAGIQPNSREFGDDLKREAFVTAAPFTQRHGLHRGVFLLSPLSLEGKTNGDSLEEREQEGEKVMGSCTPTSHKASALGGLTRSMKLKDHLV